MRMSTMPSCLFGSLLKSTSFERSTREVDEIDTGRLEFDAEVFAVFWRLPRKGIYQHVSHKASFKLTWPPGWNSTLLIFTQMMN